MEVPCIRPTALPASEFTATKNLEQCVGKDQSGSLASDSEHERTREQAKAKYNTTTSIDLGGLRGWINLRDAAMSLGDVSNRKGNADFNHRCQLAGCTKSAEGSTWLCRGHGGGQRCLHDDGGGICPKSGYGDTNFCVAHGGGKRCSIPGCSRSARGKTDCCVRHGGGKLCKFENCGKSAQGSTELCKAHGGYKRCNWGYGKCEKFARGKRGLCAAHSNLLQEREVNKGGMLGPGLFHGLVSSAIALNSKSSLMMVSRFLDEYGARNTSTACKTSSQNVAGMEGELVIPNQEGKEIRRDYIEGSIVMDTDDYFRIVGRHLYQYGEGNKSTTCEMVGQDDEAQQDFVEGPIALNPESSLMMVSRPLDENGERNTSTACETPSQNVTRMEGEPDIPNQEGKEIRRDFFEGSIAMDIDDFIIVGKHLDKNGEGNKSTACELDGQDEEANRFQQDFVEDPIALNLESSLMMVPDEYGEMNTSTMCVTPSKNVIGMEGEPVIPNQEGKVIRRDFIEGSIAMDTDNFMIVRRHLDQHGEGNKSTACELDGQDEEANRFQQDFVEGPIALNPESSLVMVSRPPDEYGERNTSTACEMTSQNVTGMEGEPVVPHQEGKEIRRDFIEGSIAMDTDDFINDDKIRGEALKRECITKSMLGLVDLQQHSGGRRDDAAKSLCAMRIFRKHWINRASTVKRIKQHRIHHWPFFQQSYTGLPDGGHILYLSEKKIARITFGRQEDAGNFLGLKGICRQLAICRKTTEKHIPRQLGTRQWPFKQDCATTKRYSFGDERPSTEVKLLSVLQLFYLSRLGKLSTCSSAIAGGGGEIGGPIALSLSESAATRNIAQRGGQGQSGFTASVSVSEITREQGDPKETKRDITEDELLRFYGKMTRDELAKHYDVSLSTIKRKIKLYKLDPWPYSRKRKVRKPFEPPDPLGEGNASTAHKTLSRYLQTGVEGELVDQNQEAIQFSQDVMEGGSSEGPYQVNDQSNMSAPYPNHNVLVSQQPQRASIQVRSDSMGGSLAWVDSLPSQVESLLDRPTSGSNNWAFVTCSNLAAPNQHVSHLTRGFPERFQVEARRPWEPLDQLGQGNTSNECEMPSHNAQTMMEGELDGQNLEANQFRQDFMEGASSEGAYQVNDQSNMTAPNPNRNVLVLQQPQRASVQVLTDSMGGSVVWGDSLHSQVEPLLDRRVSRSNNLAFATCSNLAAPTQLVSHISRGSSERFQAEGQSIQSTVYPYHNAYIPQPQIALRDVLTGIMRSFEDWRSIFPSVQELFEYINKTSDTHMVDIKAICRDNKMYIIKFPLTMGITRLKAEVSKRLKVVDDSINVTYTDKYGHLIYMDCDDDLMDYIFRSLGMDEMIVGVKEKDLNVCEKCGSSM